MEAQSTHAFVELMARSAAPSLQGALSHPVARVSFNAVASWLDKPLEDEVQVIRAAAPNPGDWHSPTQAHVWTRKLAPTRALRINAAGDPRV